VPRWEPDAQARLRATALELFAERGYENVSAEQIAEHAGLTRRTFFRYFPDKRDVVFGGSERLAPVAAKAIAEVPETSDPRELLVAALVDVASQLEEAIRPSPARQAVIASSPELRERESSKHEAVADAMATALRERGVEPTTAVLLARSGAAVFRTAFEAWIHDPGTRSLASHVEATAARLQDLWG
jgi:AcrR family transcriptional regulator